LGITELIGQGESFYKGSIPGRIHNVILASSRASGVLVGPGEVFSFNETVGDISAATGYKTAYIIKNGRTELGDGGGLCQVSTTLFRAALNAGLEIIERKPHSYRVAYYEQGGFKPGLDATVYAPSVDLKIKNNTDNHILIQAIPDPTNYHLTYEVYGKKDGRNVELSDIRILSQSPAPPPLYQEDPTLKNGEIKQVDFAASGAKTTFDYKVVKNGEVLGASTFVNNFRPWQAVFLYGPGTSVPTPPPPSL
jgi:vancomycin resistance protein YoaR